MASTRYKRVGDIPSTLNCIDEPLPSSYYKVNQEIERSRQLQKHGIRTGDRRIYWVSYQTEYGVCREIYLTAKQARIRTDELLRKFQLDKEWLQCLR